ncbi:Protein kinase, ATP binding site domain-containing protein [Rozella allomycis CSF55]|uniref:Protein kinase, ATP binding site domain-containing protein n=1 Tax=Rozella allomycis (strain CSF55) TaxID=988480 RepID=A0A075AZZ4_ROZAC|nr:Protein kinase, ATP binding site domain-containing protein [Rozella allomycis CSF55]|eukprot:EPZ34089.1 Protein kinase, ATP binding site domain-containing protein [Rozella allomycis CSF55]
MRKDGNWKHMLIFSNDSIKLDIYLTASKYNKADDDFMIDSKLRPVNRPPSKLINSQLDSYFPGVVIDSDKLKNVGKPIKWIMGKQIGKGSFGDVYLGLNAENGTLMAVKTVDLSNDSCIQKTKTVLYKCL